MISQTYIPKEIEKEFTIINEYIKYPTYLDKEFQNSISEDKIYNNYSEENIKKAFTNFLTIFSNCKNGSYEIFEKNIHNIQEYCSKLNQKVFNFILYFFILEKFANLVEKKYYKLELTNTLKKELICDDIIFECCNLNQNFSKLYKIEYQDNDKSKIYQIFNPIIERYNKLLKSENEIGNILVRTIKFLTKYLFIPFEEEINKFKKIEIFHFDNYFKSKINEENEITLLNLILHLKKLEYLDFAFYNSSILDKNDICNLEESSTDWQNLKKIFFRIASKNCEHIRKQSLETKRNPDLGFSIMSNMQPSDSTTSLIFGSVKNFFYYKSNGNKAKIDSKRYQITNSLENIKEFMGLFKKVKYIFTKMITNIEFRRKIYVKKELPSINRNYIEKLINFMKGEENIPVNSNINLESNNTINKSLPIFYKDKVPEKKGKRNYVSVTILFSEKIYFKDEKKEKSFSFFPFFSGRKSDNEIINNKFRSNTIIIAIHGGGFIGSSTLLHERYLRKWVNYLNIPIFGINYSLAPEYPYPEALNDVYQAYMWILKHAKEELNMDIKHIILSGDSAGANIALGLNSILITMKEFEVELGKDIILPELVLLQYPVTYVNLKTYSNSFILSLSSNMLNTKSLKFMYDKYVGHYEIEDQDPFLNPIKINDFILDRMTNKIRIFFGSQDVLREDGLKLLSIFSKYNNKENNKHIIDARGYDILYLGHGFNGFNDEIQQIGRNAIFPEIEDFLNSIKE